MEASPAKELEEEEDVVGQESQEKLNAQSSQEENLEKNTLSSLNESSPAVVTKV